MIINIVIIVVMLALIYKLLSLNEEIKKDIEYLEYLKGVKREER